MKSFNCPICGKKAFKATGHYNRSKRIGAPVFCSRTCFHESRRAYIPPIMKRTAKADYDKEYRGKNKAKLKENKATYHKKTYDVEKAKKDRKKKAKKHVAYCKIYYAKPENKKHKFQYDRKRRCSVYGEYSESASLLIDLKKELNRSN